MKPQFTLYILLLTALLLAGCSSQDKEAAARLQAARTAFEAGNYGEAKSCLDSIKILYPKALDARREALDLMQQIDSAEQQKSFRYFDSIAVVKQQQFDSLKVAFVLEKNKEYQEVGNYMVASQSMDKNMSRTYLRGQVSEQGVMSLTSIYNGGRPLGHKGVKLTCGDTFVETPLSADVYVSKNLGVTTEKADFNLGSDGGVIAFIALNKSNPIKVELTGGAKLAYTLRPQDADAIARLYVLARCMQSLNEVKAAREEASRHLQFIAHRKVEQAAEEAQAEKEK